MKRNCFGFVAVVYAITGIISGHGALGEDSSHETHDHHDENPSFEQAAVYVLETGANNIMILPAVGESDFAEEILLAFMVLPAESANQDGLEEAEEAAETSWEAYLEGGLEPNILADDGVALPSNSTVYAVSLEEPLVQVLLNITYKGSYALLVEHGSEEVSVVVTSAKSVVLTAVAEEGVVEDEEEEDRSSPATGQQWGTAIVASFIVSICSFAGLMIVASKRVANMIDLPQASIFASGALLTASLLHIIPEALEGLESEFDDLHELGIAAGVAILGGMFFGVVLHAFLEGGHSHGPDSHQHQHGATVGGHEGDFIPTSSVVVKSEHGEQDVMPPATMSQIGNNPAVTGSMDETSTQSFSPYESTESLQGLMDSRRGKSLTDIKSLQPVCWNIIIGDLVHNFADGVTIGAAFLGCSSTIGWTVTASAVLHEVPHELADFMALINGGMSMTQALIFNFISALSSILGVIVMLALRETLTSADVSYILLIGGGSFIFIGLAELIPEALKASSASKKQQGIFSPIWKLLPFVLGGLMIGIPLIFDKHCEAGGDGHGH